MVPFISHPNSHIPATLKPIGAASGISLGLIIAAGAAAILAFHAISFLAQMIATPIILGIGIGVAVHIVLYGPKESLRCATDLLSKVPRAIHTFLTNAPAIVERIAHMAARILPKALQHLKTGVIALPVTPYILQSIQKPAPQKKQSLPIRIVRNIHSKLTPKLQWLAAKTISLPFKAVRSVGGVIVTPVVYGVVALAVLHIALRPEPSKKMAKEMLIGAPNALKTVAKATLYQSQQVVKCVATNGFQLAKSLVEPKAPQREAPCLDL